MNSRGTATAQDEGSYLASVSDLMSGLMFIFIIALVTFALGLREQEQKQKEETERLKGTAAERQRLLESLRDDLRNEGIQVTVAPEQGVLRLGENILFPLGKAELELKGQETVSKLANVLSAVLPCYTNSNDSPETGDCGERGKAGRLDALFIEGHTDDLPLAGYGAYKDNWDLSSARSKTIFQQLLISSAERLDRLTNQDGQRVLGVSAYADRRSVVPNDSDDNRALNRRIDLRFVMVPPKELIPPVAETAVGMGR